MKIKIDIFTINIYILMIKINIYIYLTKVIQIKMILDNDSMGHIINNIFEYIEGDTINLEYLETQLYSELREVC